MGCNKNDVVSESKLTMGQTIQQYYADVRIEQRQVHAQAGFRHKIFHGISYINKEDNESPKMPEQKEQTRPTLTSLTDLMGKEGENND